MYRKFGKRFLDFLMASVGLIGTLPLTLPAFLVLSIANRGSAFFVQARPGKDGEIFKILKFKTMTDKRDAEGNLLSDKERLTRVGKFIRKTSLDEIPQLLNVLKADMSLIGPRPLLVEYLPLYNESQMRRHEVKPGITGWAQVNGRNNLSWPERFEMDLWYVENLSFKVDLRILYLTIKKVFRSEGVTQKGEATVKYFQGNE